MKTEGKEDEIRMQGGRKERRTGNPVAIQGHLRQSRDIYRET